MKMRIFTLLLAVLLFAALPLSAAARETVDLTRKDCSITLKIQYGGKTLKGGKFSCVKVADAVRVDGNEFFVTCVEGREYRESLPAAADMETLAANNKTYFDQFTQTVSNTSGTVSFQSLPPGLYLIRQTEAISGYTNLSSFLVTVPYNINGHYIYEVDADVKAELEKIPETKPPSPTPSGKLPQTGQLNWPVPLMAASGLVLFVTGWILVFRKKTDSYEN